MDSQTGIFGDMQVNESVTHFSATNTNNPHTRTNSADDLNIPDEEIEVEEKTIDYSKVFGVLDGNTIQGALNKIHNSTPQKTESNTYEEVKSNEADIPNQVRYSSIKKPPTNSNVYALDQLDSNIKESLASDQKDPRLSKLEAQITQSSKKSNQGIESNPEFPTESDHHKRANSKSSIQSQEEGMAPKNLSSPKNKAEEEFKSPPPQAKTKKSGKSSNSKHGSTGTKSKQSGTVSGKKSSTGEGSTKKTSATKGPSTSTATKQKERKASPPSKSKTTGAKGRSPSNEKKKLSATTGSMKKPATSTTKQSTSQKRSPSKDKKAVAGASTSQKRSPSKDKKTTAGASTSQKRSPSKDKKTTTTTSKGSPGGKKPAQAKKATGSPSRPKSAAATGEKASPGGKKKTSTAAATRPSSSGAPPGNKKMKTRHKDQGKESETLATAGKPKKKGSKKGGATTSKATLESQNTLDSRNDTVQSLEQIPLPETTVAQSNVAVAAKSRGSLQNIEPQQQAQAKRNFGKRHSLQIPNMQGRKSISVQNLDTTNSEKVTPQQRMKRAVTTILKSQSEGLSPLKRPPLENLGQIEEMSEEHVVDRQIEGFEGGFNPYPVKQATITDLELNQNESSSPLAASPQRRLKKSNTLSLNDPKGIKSVFRRAGTHGSGGDSKRSGSDMGGGNSPSRMRSATTGPLQIMGLRPSGGVTQTTSSSGTHTPSRNLEIESPQRITGPQEQTSPVLPKKSGGQTVQTLDDRRIGRAQTNFGGPMLGGGTTSLNELSPQRKKMQRSATLTMNDPRLPVDRDQFKLEMEQLKQKAEARRQAQQSGEENVTSPEKSTSKSPERKMKRSATTVSGDGLKPRARAGSGGAAPKTMDDFGAGSPELPKRKDKKRATLAGTEDLKGFGRSFERAAKKSEGNIPEQTSPVGRSRASTAGAMKRSKSFSASNDDDDSSPFKFGQKNKTQVGFNINQKSHSMTAADLSENALRKLASRSKALAQIKESTSSSSSAATEFREYYEAQKKLLKQNEQLLEAEAQPRRGGGRSATMLAGPGAGPKLQKSGSSGNILQHSKSITGTMLNEKEISGLERLQLKAELLQRAKEYKQMKERGELDNSIDFEGIRGQAPSRSDKERRSTKSPKKKSRSSSPKKGGRTDTESSPTSPSKLQAIEHMLNNTKKHTINKHIAKIFLDHEEKIVGPSFTPKITNYAKKWAQKKRVDPSYERSPFKRLESHSKVRQALSRENSAPNIKTEPSQMFHHFLTNESSGYFMKKADTYDINQFSFKPTINPKSQVERVLKVEDLLYQDAQRRQKQTVEMEHAKKPEPPKFTLSKSDEYVAKRLIKEFEELADGFFNPNVEHRFNFIQMVEFLRLMGFIKLNPAQVKTNYFQQERSLLFDMWIILQGERFNGVNERNLLVFLLSIMGLNFEIPPFVKQDNLQKGGIETQSVHINKADGLRPDGSNYNVSPNRGSVIDANNQQQQNGEEHKDENQTATLKDLKEPDGMSAIKKESNGLANFGNENMPETIEQQNTLDTLGISSLLNLRMLETETKEGSNFGIFDETENVSFNEEEVEQINRTYDIFYMNRLHFKKFAKTNKSFDSTMNHSFHPEIGETSKNLAINYRDKQLEAAAQIIADLDIKPPPNGRITHADLLIYQKMYWDQKNRELKQEKLENEVKACSFKPKISEYIRPMNLHDDVLARTHETMNTSGERSVNMPHFTHVGDRLHHESKMNPRPRVDRNTQDIEYEKSVEELTFYPDTAKFRNLHKNLKKRRHSADLSSSKNFNKFLDRQNKARELKEQARHVLEKNLFKENDDLLPPFRFGNEKTPTGSRKGSVSQFGGSTLVMRDYLRQTIPKQNEKEHFDQRVHITKSDNSHVEVNPNLDQRYQVDVQEKLDESQHLSRNRSPNNQPQLHRVDLGSEDASNHNHTEPQEEYLQEGREPQYDAIKPNETEETRETQPDLGKASPSAKNSEAINEQQDFSPEKEDELKNVVEVDEEDPNNEEEHVAQPEEKPQTEQEHVEPENQQKQQVQNEEKEQDANDEGAQEVEKQPEEVQQQNEAEEPQQEEQEEQPQEDDNKQEEEKSNNSSPTKSHSYRDMSSVPHFDVAIDLQNHIVQEVDEEYEDDGEGLGKKKNKDDLDEQELLNKYDEYPLQSKVIDKVPMLFVDVNFGAGRSQRIVVYDGDTAEDLADRFATEHNLDEIMKGKLKVLLDGHMAGLLSKIDEEMPSTQSEGFTAKKFEEGGVDNENEEDAN